MKKVGIITIVNVNNYGAELQAFATFRKLQLMGYNAEIINYLYYKDWRYIDSKMSRSFNSMSIKGKIIYFAKYRVASFVLNKILPLICKDVKQRIANFNSFHQHNTRFSKLYKSMKDLYTDTPIYDVYMVGKMAAFQVQNLLIAYKERFDKDNFIKNLLLDNLLLVDIYNRAKKLHIETDVRRCVFIVETKNDRDNNAFETVRNIFSAKTRDFITAVDEKNIILVKEVKNGEGYDELTKTAQVIVDMLNTEAMTKVHVAFGTIVNEIKEVSRSYKEAKMAMDVGKIFYPDKNVIAYSRLGIGRLIYQLPLPLCKMFIKEIFDGRSPDEFDEETLQTINKFFENNLNVSETSRQLYIHRNTLVYRLDKLQKSTGLDLRVFEDAITFKIALMVVKYMKYMESIEY